MDQMIKVHCQTETLSIRIDTKALTDGRFGDIIYVENSKSGQLIKVKLTGLHQAEPY